MKKLPLFFIGIGFLWLSLWSLFGGLIGAKLQSFQSDADPLWLTSLTRELMRTLHAHMNAFSFGLILIGLTIPFAQKFILKKWIPYISYTHLVGVIFFSIGLIVKIISASQLILAVSLETVSLFFLSLGSFLYILTSGAWGLLFFMEGVKK